MRSGTWVLGFITAIASSSVGYAMPRDTLLTLMLTSSVTFPLAD
jgi:hypothetical protein